jgi:hypothetical protein
VTLPVEPVAVRLVGEAGTVAVASAAERPIKMNRAIENERTDREKQKHVRN